MFVIFILFFYIRAVVYKGGGFGEEVRDVVVSWKMEEGRSCKVAGWAVVHRLFGKTRPDGAGWCHLATVVPPCKHKRARALL